MIGSIIKLVLFSAVIFGACMAIAVAVPFDDSLPPDKETAVERKQGDMRVRWYGVSAYHYGRLGSVGNRGFRGGGLHGGK